MTEQTMTAICTGLVITGLIFLALIASNCDNESNRIRATQEQVKTEQMLKAGYTWRPETREGWVKP